MGHKKSPDSAEPEKLKRTNTSFDNVWKSTDMPTAVWESFQVLESTTLFARDGSRE
jgi:hypothetical protein